MIMLILAVLGFLIVLAFLTQLGTDSYSSDEICKLSVLSRATAAEVLPGTQASVPLQCTTNKICLAAGDNGACAQFTGEKSVVKIILPKVKVGDSASEEQQALQIERHLAESMYNCWNMMGQGKLDIFGSVSKELGFSQAQSACVICTRVAIADDVNNSVLARVNTEEYMERNTVPGTSLTYVQAMTDGATSSYSDFRSEGKGKIESTEAVQIEGSSQKETAFVFMQVKSKTIGDVLTNQLQVAGVVAGSAFVAKPSSLVSAGRFVFTPAGAIATAVIATGVAGTGAYNAWQGQIAAAGYCGEFVSKSEAKQGCSLLQAIPYNVKDIRNLCGTIEGNI